MNTCTKWRRYPYLFNNHSKKWATVNGVNGYVIAPDGFAGTLADSYADDAALAADNHDSRNYSFSVRLITDVK